MFSCELNLHLPTFLRIIKRELGCIGLPSSLVIKYYRVPLSKAPRNFSFDFCRFRAIIHPIAGTTMFKLVVF